MVRKRVEFTGRVQGVGFRMRTLRIAAGLCFCLCAALVVVFSRVRTIVEAAEAQDAENQRLWHAIHELRTRQQGAT